MEAGTYNISISAVSAGETLSADLSVVITGSYSLDLTTPSGLLSADIEAGRTTTLTLNLVNTGNTDIQNVNLTSSAPDGMELVKHALMAGIEAADGADVEITCVGCPKYRVVVNAAEYKEAEEIMRNVSSAAVNDLVANGGTAVLKRESK